MTLMLIALAAIGAVTGFLAGLLGVGGGMMLVPFMTLLFTLNGFPAHLIVKIAIATAGKQVVATGIFAVGQAQHLITQAL